MAPMVASTVRSVLAAGVIWGTASITGVAVAQVAENAADPTGNSIPYPVVHLVHSTDPAQRGATADLRAHDPFLLYRTGRDLVNRQFELKYGAYGRAATLDVPLYVEPAQSLVHGASPRFARGHAASCGMCHSSVYGEPSSGQTIASTGGMGRNTTHFYGAGVVEMLGEQVRRMIFNTYDANHNGVLDRAEVEGGAKPVRIRPAPDAPAIDYGDLSPGPDGVPRLNTVFRLWYLDKDGKLIKDATSLSDPRVAAFDLAMQPFGWGRGVRRVGDSVVSQGGEAATLREFYTVAADVHLGLQAHDPTQQLAGGPSGFGGRAQVSLNGAQQFDFGGSVDLGVKKTASGISLDDPDGDGVVSELTEGDIDAIEFYLLHIPLPAVLPTAHGEEGRAVLREIGCTRCHVESWQIAARDEQLGFSGDRRFFHLETGSRTGPDGTPELVGTLKRLYREGHEGREGTGGDLTPAGGSFTVARIYTDFKHWDIGAAFYERRFDGTLQREHRTAPLWGVGSTAPYGHAGTFMSLDEAIAAHGGNAEAEAAAYRALPEERRELLLGYLRSLVLYPTEEIPADIDGDGKLANDFKVGGQRVGYERFDPRFLFKRPPIYQYLNEVTAANGRTKLLQLISNVPEAYGLDLPYRVDRDHDGFPDVLGPLPPKAGAKNGPPPP
jgi:di-heme oxidoreductase (putative peroxidase)